MSISIVSVGKKNELWIEPGVQRYEKRLRSPYDIKWVLLPHSMYEGSRACQEESERILARVGASDYVILLDERGENLTSPALSQLLERTAIESKQVVIIIGGAFGVNEDVMHRANTIWSLSKLVFPHQLVRLILVEQLYRGQEIARGGGYHHE